MMSKFLELMALPEDRRERATDIYILLMLLIFPVFTGFSGYASITISKYLFFVTTSILWLGYILILTVRSGEVFGKFSFCQRCILAYMGICCISAILSENRAYTLLGAGRFDGLISTLLYCSAFLGVSRFGHFSKKHAAAFAVSMSICSAVAILQLFGLDPLGLFPGELCYYDAHIKFSSEFLGTVGNVNLLSAVLCLAIPLFACITVGSSYLWLMPMFLCAFVLFASKVAGGTLALGLTVLASAPFVIADLKSLKRALKTLAVLLTAAAAALAMRAEYAQGLVDISFVLGKGTLLCTLAAALSGAIAFLPFELEISAKTLRTFFAVLAVFIVLAVSIGAYFYTGSSGTLYEFSQLLHGNFDDSFGSSRILIWKETLKLIPEHPILGAGPGTIGLRLDIHFSRLVEETGETLSSYVDNAHNEYLGILADCGIAGFCAYLLMLLSAFIKQLKKPLTFERCALGTAVFCYCVQSFFGLGLCLAAPLFWVLLGLFESR